MSPIWILALKVGGMSPIGMVFVLPPIPNPQQQKIEGIKETGRMLMVGSRQV